MDAVTRAQEFLRTQSGIGHSIIISDLLAEIDRLKDVAMIRGAETIMKETAAECAEICDQLWNNHCIADSIRERFGI